MSSRARRIGILAGGGSLPREFADAVAARGEQVLIVALGEAAEKDMGSHPAVRVSMGQIGKIIRAFRNAEVDGIVIIGPVRRADIARIRPDLGFFTNLPQIMKIIASGGDDGALRGVVRFFEGKGFRVLGPADIAPETLAPPGRIAGAQVGADQEGDIAAGFEVIRALGDFDIGQAVIVANRQIEAIEGAEGTNVMLERYAARWRKPTASDRRGVLIKRPKPGQELRIDMPSIGPETVGRAAAAGLAGIAVHAGNVLIAERETVVREARQHGIFVCGAEDEGAHLQAPLHAPAGEPRFQPGPARRAPGDLEVRDAKKGWEVMERLSAWNCGNVVVVARGHVLAVQAGGEAAIDVLDRVETYRRRHGAKTLRKSGVLVVRSADIDGTLVERSARAGLTAIALPKYEADSPIAARMIELLDRHGMSLLVWRSVGTG